MKRWASWVLAILLLTGCTGKEEELDRAMALRADLLAASGCSFTARITADYGDELQVFTLDCTGDNQGNVSFKVTEPESIAGITGTVSGEGGNLTFDDVALAFPLLAGEMASPVSAPWIFLKTLRSGYLTAAGEDGEYLRVTIDDSYEDDAMQVDIWLSSETKPVQGDILYDGRRILSLSISNFQIL